MNQIVTAVYENGVLRPLHPLPLSEHQTVRLQLLPEDTSNPVAEIIQLMISAGLMHPQSIPDSLPPDPVPASERRELALALGQAPGKPLSEIIMEERGEW